MKKLFAFFRSADKTRNLILSSIFLQVLPIMIFMFYIIYFLSINTNIRVKDLMTAGIFSASEIIDDYLKSGAQETEYYSRLLLLSRSKDGNFQTLDETLIMMQFEENDIIHFDLHDINGSLLVSYGTGKEADDYSSIIRSFYEGDTMVVTCARSPETANAALGLLILSFYHPIFENGKLKYILHLEKEAARFNRWFQGIALVRKYSFFLLDGSGGVIFSAINPEGAGAYSGRLRKAAERLANRAERSGFDDKVLPGDKVAYMRYRIKGADWTCLLILPYKISKTVRAVGFFKWHIVIICLLIVSLALNYSITFMKMEYFAQKLNADLKTKSEIINTLNSVIGFSQNINFHVAGKRSLDEIKKAVNASFYAEWSLEQNGLYFKLENVYGNLPQETALPARLKAGRFISGMFQNRPVALFSGNKKGVPCSKKERDSFASFVLFPLKYGNKTVRLLMFASMAEFSDTHLEIISLCLRPMETCLENHMLLSSYQKKVKETLLLLNIIEKLNSSLSLSNLTRDVVIQAQKSTNAEFSLYAEFAGDAFNITEVFDGSSWITLNHKLPVVTGIQSLILKTRKIYSSNNCDDDIYIDRITAEVFQIKRIISSPVIDKQGEIRGLIICINRRDEDIFSIDDINIIEALSRNIAIAASNSDLFAQLSRQQLELRRLSQKIINTQEDEKLRISREIHDEVGQLMSVIKLNLNMLDDRLKDGSLLEIIKLVDRGIAELRKIAYELRPTVLDDIGLAASVQSLLNIFEQSSGKNITFTMKLPEKFEDSLSGDIKLSIYRLIQESTNNAIKHSSAQTISVMMLYEDGELSISVEDNGVGFNYAAANGDKSGGVGLLGMKERAELINARLEIKSREGVGTLVSIHLPVTLQA